MKLFLWIFLPVFIFVLCKCASYAHRIAEPRMLLEAGQYDNAITALEQLASRKDNDQLLYLLDLGLAYHRNRQFTKAIDTFLLAEKISDLNDYTSITQEVGSVIFNDEIHPYKGELFEHLLINTYLALDFTLSLQWESALVECRKINHKIDRMVAQAGLPFQPNSFAKYLAASLFESQKEWNDSFVDYRAVEKRSAEFPYLAQPLLRIADRLKAVQEFEEYQKKYPEIKKYKIEKKEGEIIFILEQGLSPVKVPAPQMKLIPVFQRRPSQSDYAAITVQRGGEVLTARTYPLFDIEAMAIQELDHKLGLILAKKVGGFIAKEVLAHQIEQKSDNKFFGFLARAFLHGTDRADLRSWSTLPANLQIARLIVPAGVYSVSMSQTQKNGTTLPDLHRWDSITVDPQQKVFLNYRTQD